MLARRLRDTNSALAAASFLSVKGRVARALLSLADAFGKDVGSGRILIWQKVAATTMYRDVDMDFCLEQEVR
jgi:CRP/FNR family cyclic AMP-dependent transcriptional regulator